MPSNPFEPRDSHGHDDDALLDPTAAAPDQPRRHENTNQAVSGEPMGQPTPSRASSDELDTSELTFGSVFDNIAGIHREAAEARKTMPEDTMDDIEVSGESLNGHVEVTVKSAEISRLTISQQWLDTAHASEVARELTQVLNDTLREYNEEVMRGLQQATPEMSEVTQMIDAVRAQVRGTFDAQMNRIREESRRP